MSSIAPERIIRTVPDGRNLDAVSDTLEIRSVVTTIIDTVTMTAQAITAGDLTVGTVNGQPIAGTFVFTNTVQTLENKSLVDTTTRFVDAADSTIAARIDVAGAAGTTAVLRFTQVADSVYTVPAGAASFVMTEGAQTINGAKTFSLLSVGVISEAVVNAGVAIDGVLIRSGLSAGETVAEVTALGPAAKVSLALAPRGTGAILAELPTGAAAGGALRGNYAVDFQRRRTVAANVASGVSSVLVGGIDNRASAVESVVGGGRGNVNAGANACIMGGRNNSATAGATYGAVVGGDGNVISGTASFVGGGIGNQATGATSAVSAGIGNIASGSGAYIGYGTLCAATANYSSASGQNARSLHNNSVVMRGRSTPVNFDSTAPEQFSADFNLYRWIGGVMSWNDRIAQHSDGSATTVGATTTTLYAITIPLNTANIFTLNITGVIPGGDIHFRRVSVHLKNLAGAVDIRSSFDSYELKEPAVLASSIALVEFANQFVITVTGVAGLTMNWRGDLMQRYIPF